MRKLRNPCIEERDEFVDNVTAAGYGAVVVFDQLQHGSIVKPHASSPPPWAVAPPRALDLLPRAGDCARHNTALTNMHRFAVVRSADPRYQGPGGA